MAMTQRGGPVFEHEKIHINLAFMKKGGAHFEIVIDPDAAIRFKETGHGDVDDVVKAQKVFSDAHKGLLASEERMRELLGTTVFEEVAKRILKEGEIQLTTEHRDKVRAQKLRALIAKIHRNAVDPKTGNPHPEKRIELAFDEAKIKVDELRSIEQQLNDVVKRLQPILPLKFETSRLTLRVPTQYAGKLRGEVARVATIVSDSWQNDGSWQATVELPAGMKPELIDLVNSMTHGGATVTEQKH
jgi:ribosome maturation protein SDO1